LRKYALADTAPLIDAVTVNALPIIGSVVSTVSGDNTGVTADTGWTKKIIPTIRRKYAHMRGKRTI